MKQLVLAIMLLCSQAVASTGWFQDYVKMNKNGGGENYYWIGSNPSFGTQLDGLNLGSVSTLVITGSDMKYWSDTQDRTGGAFYWMIKSSDGSTTISGPNEVTWSHAGIGGNDFQGTSTNSINVLTGLNGSTTYQLHIYAKSTGSNQGDSYLSNGGSNYVATFTTDAAVPVLLSSFNAILDGSTIRLTWRTEMELENIGFDVERKPYDNGSWTSLGFVKGQGTTNAASSYSYSDNVSAAGTYSYRLKQIDRDGKFTYSNAVEATVALTPNDAGLHANYPNPFNPSTAISFTLGATGRASLKVYDVLGKEVATVAEGMFVGGERNTFTFDAAGLTSGVYYYRLLSDAKIETRKMLLMK